MIPQDIDIWRSFDLQEIFKIQAIVRGPATNIPSSHKYPAKYYSFTY